MTKRKLTPEEHAILKERGTEPPFTGEYLHNKKDGTYHCAGCGMQLFSSKKKFDSGTGWPSFSAGENIEHEEDTSHGMTRTEVHCKRCKGHLGHLFKEDTAPEGRRYCINSSSLKFEQR